MVGAERARYFCVVCGGMVQRPSFDPEGRAYCAGHRDLARLPLLPPDPLTRLPTMAREFRTLPSCTCAGGYSAERGLWHDSSRCPIHAAPRREDTSPAKGTEA